MLPADFLIHVKISKPIDNKDQANQFQHWLGEYDKKDNGSINLKWLTNN